MLRIWTAIRGWGRVRPHEALPALVRLAAVDLVLLAIVDVVIGIARFNEQPHDLSNRHGCQLRAGADPLGGRMSAGGGAPDPPSGCVVACPAAHDRDDLLAFAVVLQLFEAPLLPVFQALTPAADDGLSIVPLSVAYNALYTMVTALGLVYVGLGLTQERRYEDRRADPDGLDRPLPSPRSRR